ncbi:MAG: elongation factor G, partial [Planctomycetota bacterium]|nr:elongation factor G [Planctomycetota bacterium]
MAMLLEKRFTKSAKLSPLETIRNIGIVAHIDSGKTTITERMLKVAGKIRVTGEVHDGEATMDFLKEEQERGITIGSAATHFDWGGFEVNLIDTPGHVDFTAEVERVLRVLDGAVLAIDSVAGAQAQSETVNRQLDKYSVPRLVFVNKMDRVGSDFSGAVDSVRERLHLNAVPIQIPMGEGPEFRSFVDLIRMEQVYFPEHSEDPAAFKSGPVEEKFLDRAREARYRLLEALSMHSDELMEILLEERQPDEDFLYALLRQATIRHGFVPVLLGAALRNRGIPVLLDAIVSFLPSPADVGAVPGKHPATGQDVAFEPDPSAPLGALVFKTIHYSTGDLTFIRVYSGRVLSGKGVYNPRLRRHERVGRLYRVHASSRVPVEEASAGQIVACMGLRQSATGDTLCQKDHPIVYGATIFAEPVISMAIEPRSTADRDRLAEILAVVAREDPTFRVHTDPETGETLISGMGELHLEVVAHRLRDEFRLDVRTGKPRVAYRQTLRKAIELESRHIKQTGGSGQYAVARLKFEPVDGDGLEFVDEIKRGKISAEFLDALERGIREYCESGGRLGAPLQGIRATCFDGKMHDVDSSQLAFYACGTQAMRQAEERAETVVLEPIMRVVVTAPKEYLGSVLGDISSRRGDVVEVQDEGGDKRVICRVPLAALPAYAT